jgi:hypothetical protein
VPAQESQRILRHLFAQWGRPRCLRVDNGTPWGSWSDLPTDLALWVIGLGLDMHWNHPRRPQENGVIERSQGTGKNWAEPFACDSVAQVQVNIDDMDRIQREVYPVVGTESRQQAFPGLAHSGRSYSLAWEEDHWDFQRVVGHLSGYAVTRRIGPAGHMWIYNRRYYVGIVHAKQSAQVMFDPDQLHWLVADSEGRLLNRLAVKEITEANIRNLEVTLKETSQDRLRRRRKKSRHG